jgi:hypothetical protein
MVQCLLVYFKTYGANNFEGIAISEKLGKQFADFGELRIVRKRTNLLRSFGIGRVLAFPEPHDFAQRPTQCEFHVFGGLRLLRIVGIAFFERENGRSKLLNLARDFGNIGSHS